MNDKKLLKIVRGFTKGLLGKKKPTKMCYAVCAPLETFLALNEVECRLKEVCVVQGQDVWFHWYLELNDGRILDPTASQFVAPDGQRMPEIYLGERPFWYQLKKNKRKKYSPLNNHL